MKQTFPLAPHTEADPDGRRAGPNGLPSPTARPGPVKSRSWICLAATGLLLACFFVPAGAAATGEKPFRLAIARLTHGHSGWIFGSKQSAGVSVVGIYEPDTVLAREYRERYQLDEALFHTDLEEMLDKLKPEGVAAFGSIYEHLEVVEACAPRGIHVMVEKPLAFDMKHALRMEELVREHGIQLLTNYETSWYPSVHKAYQLLNDSASLGKLRKVVIHAGHQGPQEIGVGKEFLDWLTDPAQNGGGALIDFGCYGANLMTWLTKGQAPLAVTAVTRQYKKDRYPRVDDEASLIIDYPEAQCIVQASWNWPFNRKDMEVYGESGYIITLDDRRMRLRVAGKEEQLLQVSAEELNVEVNPFDYFAAQVRSGTNPPEHGLYAFQTNLIVVRILDAARESARTGKTVYLR